MTSIQNDSAANSSSTQQERPKTAADRIKELFPRSTTLPPYVGGGYENPNVREAKEAARRRESRQQNSGPPQRRSDLPHMNNARQPLWNHPSIRTSFPMPVPQVEDAPPKKVAQNTSNPEMQEKLRSIVKVAAPIVGIEEAVLLTKEKTARVSRKRQMIAYFMLYYTKCTLRDAATVFGHVDHTSVKHGAERMIPVLERGPMSELETELLVGLKKLCEHYGTELPPSKHWPDEPEIAEEENPFQRMNAD